jgi:8-oxo-dGTP diphosphatase
MADYHKAGLLILQQDRILLCRKRHTTALLILPGGRFEPGETARQCIAREIREELGHVDVTGLEFVGSYTDVAAGAPAKTVRIELYRGDLAGVPSPQSEIRELVWFSSQDDWAQLAPSLANKILPDLIERKILLWAIQRSTAGS